MDRCVAVYKNKKYKAFSTRIKGEVSNVKLFLHWAEDGFIPAMSAYDEDLYEKEVKIEEVSELYREFFMAKYKHYEFFVHGNYRDSNEIEVVTIDSNIGRECHFNPLDRDFFTKRLNPRDDYQLIYVKEDYLSKITTRKEVTLEEFYILNNEKFK
ncbi:hypothetical protein [Bacillus sp. USDA818B3_A]|uniref:hypothetical protein n=1 Tax=Bacillus sp. USDA818B3_A TaxID=2698834 RepID=UPI00136C4388|nr:hypothetical protein [Bacillus sp. USDA818B3_A]